MRAARLTALALVASWLALAAPAAAAPAPAELADTLAERWAALQRPDATFPDSIRPDTHGWGRYGEAGVGYGLLLAGVRAHRPDWVEAGARAQAFAAETAVDRLSVFESMLIASGYNLLRTRAPATPTFAARRALWERYLQEIKPVYNARIDAPQLHSNKYIVEAVADLELARSGLRSDVPGAVLSRRGEARRRGLDILNRIVPRRVDVLIGHAAGHRVTAMSDRDRQPLAYHALTVGLLARAIDVAGPAASRAARRALRTGVRTIWAYQAPDGDLAYFGRSQGQAWALALAALAARRAATGPCDRQGRAFRAVADRALGRLGSRYPIGAGGMAIVPSANGPATIPAIDDYASEVVYNGLTLTALGWAADTRLPAGCRPGRLLADRDGAGAVLPFEDARFATLRSDRVWMAVKQASQPPDGRAAFGLRALKYRAAGGSWVDVLPAAPQAGGAPTGMLGPALKLRSGALARPRGTSIRVRRGRIVVGGGWARDGRWVRRHVDFRFVATRRGARIVVPTRRRDRIVYSALSAGRPQPGARGIAGPGAGHARVRRHPRPRARAVRLEQLARRLARRSRGARPRAARHVRGSRELSVAPALATDTIAIATIPVVLRSWPRMRYPSSPAMAGSRLMITPNSAVGSRRSAISSNAYGSSGISSASPTPASSTSGASSSSPAPAMPTGSATSVATTSDTESPSSPAQRAPTFFVSRM